MRYLIRKFQEKDFNSIKRLRKEFAKEVGVKDKLSIGFVSTAMIEYLKNNYNYSMFVAEINEKVIGNALITYYKIPASTANITGVVGYVSNVYVMKKYRCQKIGTKLMETIMDDAVSKGAGKVELLASDKGINIYKRLGFKRDSEFTYMKMFI